MLVIEKMVAYLVMKRLLLLCWVLKRLLVIMLDIEKMVAIMLVIEIEKIDTNMFVIEIEKTVLLVILLGIICRYKKHLAIVYGYISIS